MCTLLYVYAQLHHVIIELCVFFLMAIALRAVQMDGALSSNATSSSSVHCFVSMHYHIQDCKLCKQANIAVDVSNTAIMTDCLQFISASLL